jgi:hypothetical protein
VSCAGSEEIASIHGPVAHELERCTVEVVSARTRHDVHNATGRIPVFRREVAGLKIKFLQCVGIRKRQVHIDIGIVVIRSVKLVIDLGGSGAIDARNLRSGVNATVAILSTVAASEIHGACRKKDERLSAATIQRKVDDAFSVDELPLGSGASCHQIGVCLDCHRLGQLAQLHGDGLICDLIDREFDARLHISGETLFINAQLVCANREA